MLSQIEFIDIFKFGNIPFIKSIFFCDVINPRFESDRIVNRNYLQNILLTICKLSQHTKGKWPKFFNHLKVKKKFLLIFSLWSWELDFQMTLLRLKFKWRRKKKKKKYHVWYSFKMVNLWKVIFILWYVKSGQK